MMRRPRDWEQELALDAYSVEGALLSTMDLEDVDWLGLGPIPNSSCVLLWRPPLAEQGQPNPSDGEQERPAIMRACVEPHNGSAAQ